MKHVSFALNNATYSIPSTPSPTSSLSSLPSLPAPSTPPLVHHLLPHHHHNNNTHERHLSKPRSLPQPPSLVEMNIHRVLAYDPYGAPVANYNLFTSPPSASVLNDYQFDYATNPALSSLTILVPNLSTSIVAVPTTSSPKLTVSDVFHALYYGLHASVVPSEYDGLSQKARRAVDAAYYDRCRRVPGGPAEQEAERMRGIKRIDFLMGRTQFLGLSATTGGEDVWDLNVG